MCVKCSFLLLECYIKLKVRSQLFLCPASGEALGMAMSVGWMVHHFDLDWDISITIGMKSYTGIYGPQRRNPIGVGDPLTSPVAST